MGSAFSTPIAISRHSLSIHKESDEESESYDTALSSSSLPSDDSSTLFSLDISFSELLSASELQMKNGQNWRLHLKTNF